MSDSTQLLLVTENQSKRTEIQALLAEHNVVTYNATNSTQAVELLKEETFDIIVSETDIGDMDAWRLVRMLRANLFRCTKETPFILLTDTYCEHIAETTANAFAINSVIASDKLSDLGFTLSNLLQEKQTSIHSQKVLIVEDDNDICELAARLLKTHYVVDVAMTGVEGLQKYRETKYDIVLLDVQMPGMTGPEVLENIMRINPRQAVVIMTAHGGTDLAEALMIKGAVDFIQKPFKGDQLRRVVGIAAHRENYLISNAQFEEKVLTIKRREDQYKNLSEAHTRLLNHLSTVVMELDAEGLIKFVNKAWLNLTGYERSETVGLPLVDFAFGDDDNTKNFVKHHLDSIFDGSEHYKKIEFQLARKDGSAMWVEVQFNDLYRQGQVSGVTVTLDNIDDRKKAELELNHLASHDTLTNLYNRHYFDTELKRLADTAQNSGYLHALLYLDLDHFKVINDTQGHHQGDIILKEVAETIAKVKRESDVFCRVGGDEFALLLPRTNKVDAQGIAQSICDLLQQGHYKFDERIYKISCSIGVAEINGEEERPETYLQQADIALYVAKKRGRNLVHMFGKEDRESGDFQASVQWVHVLQEAIVNDQLILHFQPVVDADTREVHYYEALVRLEIDGKLIMPGEFIPALERVEDINLLDHQVISKAMSMISEYKVLKKVAINLSAQAFSDERLLPLVQEKLGQYGVEPGQIIFEVTESASLTNLGATQDMIGKLMELGCEFSIDDFGTGFSTFSYLKQLPANCVKVDGSFVKDIVNNPIDKALVKSICEVASALDKTTVAEFVEDETTAIELKQLGVNYLQGYHISRPLSIDFIEEKYRC